MEPTREQPERSDNQTPLPRSRPESFVGPIQRRPPLSRGSAPQPMARQPHTPETLTQASVPEFGPVQPLAVPPELTPATPSPEPVIQMPQPESLSPPQTLQTTQLPHVPAPQPASAAPPNDPAPPQPVDFTPPPAHKKKNIQRFLKPAIAVLIVMVIGVGIFGYAKVMAARNNPDTVMRDAISNSLSLTTVQATTKSGQTTVTTKYDFTDSKNPVVSTANSIATQNGQAMLNGYGDLKNTYINYESLPKVVSAKLSKQMNNTWVYVRQNGEMPKNVPALIFKASDPRYQAFGPILMGNFEGTTKQQLVDFVLKNKVYGYEAEKVKKEKLGDKTVFAFPIQLDVTFLQVATQSAALNAGLTPEDIQLATEAMEALRDAKITLYVDAGDHTFTRMYISKDDTVKTIDLSGYKDTKVPAAPQTRLLWSGFTAIQNQVEAQTNLTKSAY